MRVTVIAAGFDGGMPKKRDNGTVLRREPAPQVSQAEVRAAARGGESRGEAPQPTFRPSAPEASPAEQPARPQPSRQAEPAPASNATRPGSPGQGAPAQPARQPRPVQFDDDELDVPDFLK